MKEIRYGGNLFLLGNAPNAPAAYAVTTNGLVKSDGKAVMGAGIAKYARDNFDGIDAMLGRLLKKYGNHAYFLGSHEDRNRSLAGLSPTIFAVSFPTKHDWREKSDIRLIRASAAELMKVADANNLKTVYMPMPGCSNGGLDYASQVRPAIAGILDDRFWVAVPPDLYDTLA